VNRADLTKGPGVIRWKRLGALAPSTGCDIPKDIGHQAFVPYTADYFFYKN
jgi:hypothetical protein